MTSRRPEQKYLVPANRFVAAICLLALSGCAAFADRVIRIEPDPITFGRNQQYNMVEAGREIAQRECASCHAIDFMSVSPDPRAPPLNSVLSRQNSDELTDALIAGIHVRNSSMPTFDFNVIAADSLAEYLESIQR